MSAMLSFFLAMVIYPNVQRNAQAELDATIGRDRLPNFEDRASLVYINAIVKECLRWQPTMPLSGHHQSMEDDEYNGFLIPKGSLVIGNSWSVTSSPDATVWSGGPVDDIDRAMLHDQKVYPQPDVFMPERYIKDGKLDPGVRDPATAAFGFGRR